MKYGELVELYFHRSAALQWYWTLYVVVIGGLLAFATIRRRPDLVKTILVTILYVCFAYKNLGAIRDTTMERFAILETLQAAATAPGDTNEARLKSSLEPTLDPPAYPGTRTFHVACDVMTVAAVWAMEWRRRKAAVVADLPPQV